MTYRYRAETFRVYFYRLGLPFCVGTRSDIMRVSRSGTSKLKIPEIFKICWPASKPCKQGTTRVKGSIFSMRPLPTPTYPLCKWEGISMHRLGKQVCQSWGKYGWNMEIAGQNVLFWRGSTKWLDLHMTYRYRVETFRIYFYRLGLPSCVVTWSDLMRVSHSGTSKLKIPEILKICWHASEPCKQVTTRFKGSIFSMPPLRTGTYPLRKREGISMHRLGKLVGQSWGKYMWNMEIAGQNVLFRRGSIKRLDLPMTYRYRAETCGIYFYRLGLPSWVDTRSDLVRVSYSGTSKLIYRFQYFYQLQHLLQIQYFIGNNIYTAHKRRRQIQINKKQVCDLLVEFR